MVKIDYLVHERGGDNDSPNYMYSLNVPFHSTDLSHVMNDDEYDKQYDENENNTSSEPHNRIQLEQRMTRYIPIHQSKNNSVVKQDKLFYKLYQKHNDASQKLGDSKWDKLNAFQNLFAYLEKTGKTDSKMLKELQQIKDILSDIQQKIDDK